MRFFRISQLAIVIMLAALVAFGQESAPTPASQPTLIPSENPHGGFLLNWIPRRNSRPVEAENSPANVTELSLERTIFYTSCTEYSGPACDSPERRIRIKTAAEDKDEDIIVYRYTVSAGKIVGEGSAVVWDLSEAAPGRHTITAGVDDGCGICGKTDTRTVEIIDPQSNNKIALSKTELCMVCPFAGSAGETEKRKLEEMVIEVSTNTSRASSNFNYYYSVTGGKIIGDGPDVQWDLRDAEQGTYTISVGIGKNRVISGEVMTQTVNVGYYCGGCCMKPCDCAAISTEGPEHAKPGDTIVLTGLVSEGFDKLTFKWTVTGGTIVGSADGKTILVKIPRDSDGSSVIANFEVEGTDPGCDCPTQNTINVPVSHNKIPRPEKPEREL